MEDNFTLDEATEMSLITVVHRPNGTIEVQSDLDPDTTIGLLQRAVMILCRQQDREIEMDDEDDSAD